MYFTRFGSDGILARLFEAKFLLIHRHFLLLNTKIKWNFNRRGRYRCLIMFEFAYEYSKKKKKKKYIDMHNSKKKNRVIRREQKIVEEDMQSITNTMMYQCQESVMMQPNLNLPIIFLLIKYAT